MYQPTVKVNDKEYLVTSIYWFEGIAKVVSYDDNGEIKTLFFNGLGYKDTTGNYYDIEIIEGM